MYATETKNKSIVSPDEILWELNQLCEEAPNQVVYSTSFGPEAQVLTHLIFCNDLPIEVFTLDTGRLFPETLDLKLKTEEKYKKTIKVYRPNQKLVDDMVREKGAYSFYESLENRKECCRIRKTNQMGAALAGKKYWISGVRADQSHYRNGMEQMSWNEKYQLHKFFPLFYWTEKDVWDFIQKYNLDTNPLHQKGYPSIGCEPCTRAIKPGEDPRAGRWWWEQKGNKECGMHQN